MKKTEVFFMFCKKKKKKTDNKDNTDTNFRAVGYEEMNWIKIK
jgi:hypothetical protein